jgi:hypothetical protein
MPLVQISVFDVPAASRKQQEQKNNIKEQEELHTK